MLEILGSIVGNIFAGGATGLLGAGMQMFFAYKNKQLDLELEDKRAAHELAMRDKDAAIMAQEWAARTQVAEIEADGKALEASYKLDEAVDFHPAELTRAQTWALLVVEVWRKSIRPGLTTYLAGLTTLLYLDAHAVVSKLEMPTDVTWQVYLTIVNAILYLTVTCGLWWFGSRMKEAAFKPLSPR